MPQNEVKIVVKAVNQTKETFDAVRAESALLGDSVAKTINEHVTVKLTQSVQQSRANYERAGEDAGNVFGDRIRQRVTEKIRMAFRERVKIDADVDTHGGGIDNHQTVHVKTDVDNRTFLQRFGDLGKKAGEAFDDKFGSITSTFFSGDFITLILKAVGGVGLGALLAPVLGAGITAAILGALGGGVIAAGIAGALKDPATMGAVDDFKNQLAAGLAKFGEPFQKPIQETLKQLGEVVAGLMPQIQQLGQIFAPVVETMGTAFANFLKVVMPAILKAAEAAAPLFEQLAYSLEKLAPDIASFFTQISKNGPAAKDFVRDLFNLIGILIRYLGNLINFLARFYATVRQVGQGAIRTFNQIRGVVGDVVDVVRDLINKIRELRGKNISITITQVFKQVGSWISGAWDTVTGALGFAHGGIVGAATGGNHGGLRMVGEHGPELLDLPAGTRVHSNPDTERMLSQGGSGGGSVTVRFDKSGLSGLAAALMETLRAEVRTEGGSVQQVLGVPGVA
jgi:hypothetical protein